MSILTLLTILRYFLLIEYLVLALPSVIVGDSCLIMSPNTRMALVIRLIEIVRLNKTLFKVLLDAGVVQSAEKDTVRARILSSSYLQVASSLNS